VENEGPNKEEGPAAYSPILSRRGLSPSITKRKGSGPKKIPEKRKKKRGIDCISKKREKDH